ncbi:MAG: ribose-5-phosphate isomerase RpiA [Ignavibacterium sp.]|nr:ribose-5-phosphate isomerase RpiA [Ignavibacterium sp.]
MNEKQLAAERSVDFIKDGMTVGLGTGSTVNYMIDALAQKVKKGLKIKTVATSKLTFQLAASSGIDVVDLELVDRIDLTIDGADEVDPQLNGIKGGGAALLYEKIVASNSAKNIWIVDSSKLVKKLGRFPLPVEVIPYGSNLLISKFEKKKFKPAFRKFEGNNFITDGGHFLIDLNLEKIDDPKGFEEELKTYPGVVEVGLFAGIADMVIVGEGKEIRIIDRMDRPAKK